MKPVVYADVLFAVNFLINFILLWTTGKIAKIRVEFVRLAIGASLGAIYAVIMFFPALRIYYTIIAKVLFSMLLIAVTFNIEKVKEYTKTLAIFYFVSFSFGGAVLGLFYFTDAGRSFGAFLSNGIIYFNLPWKILLISVVVSYLIITAVWHLMRKRINSENYCIPLSIIFDARSVNLNALIDTGNSLYDPISKFPVVIVEFLAIKEILPEEIQKIFIDSGENDLNLVYAVISDSKWVSRFRLIPFSSLGSRNGMLIGFKPDGIDILGGDERKGVSDIIVGIYNHRLSKNEEYRALLHPEIIS